MAAPKLSARSWRILAALGFWALIAVAALLRGTGGLVLAYIAGVWLIVFSLLAWRRQDEYVRAAQKFSWIFGGLLGLLASIALLPALLQPAVIAPLLGWIGDLLRAPDGPPPDPAAPAFLLGAVWIVAGQLVGFLVCWVGWHVAKR
jgi:hypothetical protein